MASAVQIYPSKVNCAAPKQARSADIGLHSPQVTANIASFTAACKSVNDLTGRKEFDTSRHRNQRAWVNLDA